MSRWTSTRICQHCKGRFQSSRSDAKYCSPKCRKQVNLAKKKIDDLGRSVLATIRILNDYCEQETYSEQSAEILGQIRRSLDFTDNRCGSSPAAAPAAAQPPVFDIDEPSLNRGAAIPVHTAVGTATNLGDKYSQLDLSVKALEHKFGGMLERIVELENQVDWRPANAR